MILILGGSGYIGQAYQNYFNQKHIKYLSLKRSDVNYTNTAILTEALRRTKAQFLINAAGYTGKPNVDACELNKADCLDGNVSFPIRVAHACTVAGVPWGHVSSGCIYTGARSDGSGFTETDPPNFSFRQNNCSFYSGTKALCEEILNGSPNVYIWRLRIPFNNRENPRNYLTKIMRYECLLDATNSISQLRDFVSASWECWEKRVPFGIYNLTNPGQVSTRQVVNHIIKSGIIVKKYKFFKSESEFMAIAAKTPRSNCVLDSSKLETVGIKMTEVNEAIVRDLKRWQRVS